MTARCHRLIIHGARAISIAVAILAAPLSHGAEVSARIVDQRGKAVADVVVYATASNAVTSNMAPTTVAEKARAVAIEQIDQEFVPYVTAVLVGTSIQFPNRDNTRHHVYSFSAAKKFDLPLYAGTAAAPVLFDKPGVIVIGCNIHDWMIGYIDVLETPFFAKTDSSGTATIKGLPPGDYTVQIWHPDMMDNEAATNKQLTIVNQSAAELSWQIRVRPATRRRAPLPTERGY